MCNTRPLALTALVALAISFNTMAAPPYQPNLVQGGNKWTVEAYDDSDPDHTVMAKQGVCFKYAGTKGTHQLYTWYSDTFIGWQGTAVQEGNNIFMHGVYAMSVGHDAMQARITTDSPAYTSGGHWQEWREDGSAGRTIGFANLRMDHVGDCTLTAIQALTGFGLPFYIRTPGLLDNPMTTVFP